MPEQTRIMIVDDHALIRQGLASLLSSQPDLTLVAQARSGEQALELARRLKPDLVLMDLTMPGMGGLAAMQHLVESLPNLQVIMLTESDDEDRLFEAVQLGAMGYVLKDTATETLVPMIRRVLHGEAALSGVMAAKMLSAFKLVAEQAASCPWEQDFPVLTPREREVLHYVAQGCMDREISDRLSISLSTVKTHVRNILSKLHATSRHQAALLAIREGLIRPPNA